MEVEAEAELAAKQDPTVVLAGVAEVIGRVVEQGGLEVREATAAPAKLYLYTDQVVGVVLPLLVQQERP